MFNSTLNKFNIDTKKIEIINNKIESKSSPFPTLCSNSK